MSLAFQTVKILNAGTTSESFNLSRYTAGTFTIPAAITGTTIQPKFSNDNTNWTSVGSPISVAANGTYVLPTDFFKAAFGQLVSNGSEAAERSIILGLKD